MEESTDSGTSDDDIKYGSAQDPMTNLKRQNKLEKFLSQQSSMMSSEDDTTPISCNNFKYKKKRT